MQTFGLEWLYRLAREPRRLPRQLTIPHFMGVIIVTRARDARRASRQELPPR
jgi:UDP-N-acetyl-D-mannosaminuronic acid transferase (WecB/TagA/CpsF family)